MSTRVRRLLAAALSASLVGALAPCARGDDAACINAVEQGLTLRQKGQLREALKVLAACGDASCPAELRTECAQRIDAIDHAMPTIVLAAKDGSGNDLYDVKVTMDGSLLMASLDGRPISVDPGEHDFVFETDGQPPLEKKLVLREGEKNRAESVVLGPPPPAPPPVPAPTSLVPAPAPAPPPESSWSTQKTLAIATGTVGIVGVGLGAMWGAFAMSAQNDEKNNCSSKTACPEPNQASEDYKFANLNATGSTIAISAGAALVATGVVLWFTAPSHKKAPTMGLARWHVAPTVLRSGGAIAVGGEL
jgi:hypothetical protein